MDANCRPSIRRGFRILGKTKKILKLVTERTLQISAKPFIYKSTDFKDVRVNSLRNFSIYYKVTDEQIIVTAFWDNRQDPKKLLKILQNK